MAISLFYGIYSRDNLNTFQQICAVSRFIAFGLGLVQVDINHIFPDHIVGTSMI